MKQSKMTELSLNKMNLNFQYLKRKLKHKKENKNTKNELRKSS
jgi:hypothetical protein